MEIQELLSAVERNIGQRITLRGRITSLRDEKYVWRLSATTAEEKSISIVCKPDGLMDQLHWALRGQFASMHPLGDYADVTGIIGGSETISTSLTIFDLSEVIVYQPSYGYTFYIKAREMKFDDIHFGEGPHLSVLDALTGAEKYAGQIVNITGILTGKANRNSTQKRCYLIQKLEPVETNMQLDKAILVDQSNILDAVISRRYGGKMYIDEVAISGQLVRETSSGVGFKLQSIEAIAVRARNNCIHVWDLSRIVDIPSLSAF